MAGEKKARVANQSATDLRGNSSPRNFPSPGALPPDPRKRRRAKFLTLTFKPEDFEVVRAEAERQGYRLRTFCRRAILEKVEATQKLPSAQELKTAYRALSRELRRWGVNLNQIAKRCNERRGVDREVLRKLEKIDRALEHIIEVVKP